MTSAAVRVLVVDDEPDMLFLVRTILGPPRWDVVGEACRGADAVSQAIALEPDVAVIDFMMPGMNGLEVADAIRAAVPRCRNVIFTAHGTIARDEARHASVDGFISKTHITRLDEALAEVVAPAHAR